MSRCPRDLRRHAFVVASEESMRGRVVCANQHNEVRIRLHDRVQKR